MCKDCNLPLLALNLGFVDLDEKIKVVVFPFALTHMPSSLKGVASVQLCNKD